MTNFGTDCVSPSWTAWKKSVRVTMIKDHFVLVIITESKMKNMKELVSKVPLHCDTVENAQSEKYKPNKAAGMVVQNHLYSMVVHYVPTAAQLQLRQL